MIVRVRRGSAPREEYLALQLTESGEWIALTTTPDPSADEAARRCLEGIRRQMVQLQENTNRKLGMLQESLRRLWDAPASTDVVRIAREVCPVDESGAVMLSQSMQKAKRGRVELAAQVDDAILGTLRDALELPEERERAIGMIIDLVLDTPLDVLLRVYETRAAALSEVAGFMVRLRLAASTRSTSDEQSTNSQRPSPKEIES